jgi:hypothetical protein
MSKVMPACKINQNIGNCYTGSVFASLLSVVSEKVREYNYHTPYTTISVFFGYLWLLFRLLTQHPYCVHVYVHVIVFVYLCVLEWGAGGQKGVHV